MTQFALMVLAVVIGAGIIIAGANLLDHIKDNRRRREWADRNRKEKGK